LKVDTRLEADIEKLRDMALDDLLNAFSALRCAVQSPRREFLQAAADEYRLAMLGKLRYAFLISGLTEPSAVYKNHAEGQSTETDASPVVEGSGVRTGTAPDSRQPGEAD
jgi:hypothetical protein